MCCLQNIAMDDYQESVTTGQTQTHGQEDAGQSDPYVPLCFAGDTKISIIDICYTNIALIPKTLIFSLLHE